MTPLVRRCEYDRHRHRHRHRQGPSGEHEDITQMQFVRLRQRQDDGAVADVLPGHQQEGEAGQDRAYDGGTDPAQHLQDGSRAGPPARLRHPSCGASTPHGSDRTRLVATSWVRGDCSARCCTPRRPTSRLAGPWTPAADDIGILVVLSSPALPVVGWPPPHAPATPRRGTPRRGRRRPVPNPNHTPTPRRPDASGEGPETTMTPMSAPRPIPPPATARAPGRPVTAHRSRSTTATPDRPRPRARLVSGCVPARGGQPPPRMIGDVSARRDPGPCPAPPQ
jgi:hypothetical protein